MNKNKISKILLVLIIIVFGFGKIYLSKNRGLNTRSNFIAQNNKSDNSKSANQKKQNLKQPKDTSSKSGNRKYNIDYDHVIGGDENSRGKVTGGHSLLHGDVRIVKKVGNPAKNGVYRASIEVKKKDGTWQEKTSNGGVNTMFPENWDEARIIDEINSAWENRKDVKGKDSNMWQGISKSGVLIRGYKSPRITAYPIYENR